MDAVDRIKAKREAAKRARWMAERLSDRRDRLRILAFAEDLDALADALERESDSAPFVPPTVATRAQVQVQQQAEAKDPKKPKKE